MVEDRDEDLHVGSIDESANPDIDELEGAHDSTATLIHTPSQHQLQATAASVIPVVQPTVSTMSVVGGTP